MADTRPTPISLFQAVRLCLLLIFSPRRFIAEENKDIAERNNYSAKSEPPHRALIVRQALFSSLGLVLASGAVGYAGGKLIYTLGRCATTDTTFWLQATGACLLLWGTLFIRGWEIQTFSGVVFTERVNRWLYRCLYCAGTAVVVYSLSFATCAK